ncbi:xanthine dehydrogenase family protein molybdopterin-binding subunit [Rhodoligotrophos defluvii]|uniref:xanthine dehydrogenase family protein molybdopterin-binding subunit n=1 Tax=Rhodoligotrophos defluvii TaxID=2561934 RepID=UPI0010C9809F|nr:xanthine dehydrogenase family protein molybdopterin-binding subunit [Rhodoligotrophos defluvii]
MFATHPEEGAWPDDARLLTGGSRFTEDLESEDSLHAIFVRSPVAHARIRSVSLEAALATPGVVGVFTGADLQRDRVGNIPIVAPLVSVDGRRCIEPPRPPLAVDKVRHVGEAVAIVVASSLDAARNGSSAVYVDFEEEPAIVDAETAIRDDAPVLWPEAPGNICFTWEKGDEAAVSAAFARASHVVKLKAACNRVSPSPLETRAVIGFYEPSLDRVTIHTPSQGVHLIHDLLCNRVLNLPPEKLRVITQDVGGGFGLKYYLYPEHAVIAWVTRTLERSVRWIGSRSEAFLSDTQARDQVATCELALDAQGDFLALRMESDANLGAYLSNFAAVIPSEGAAKVASGPYRIPAMFMRVRGVFTNTVPVDAYRGAGKPEMAYFLERLVDVAALETGHDPIALRERNLIPSACMPYITPLGTRYDSGDFPSLMRLVLTCSNHQQFEERRAASRARGQLRGFGLACYVHITGGFARGKTRVEVDPNGSILIFTGTQSNGHRHEISFARIAADALGMDPYKFRLHQGDTATIPAGGGTGGSSSTIIAGNSITLASEDLVERGRLMAANVLEACLLDIAYERGAFRVAGTDREVSLFELARLMANGEMLPAECAGPLVGEADFRDNIASCPSGVVAAEVEIDRETGCVSVVNLAAVQDAGRVIDQALIDGQIHGGITQALGQALLEEIVYDRQTAQLLSTSYMTYVMPRAVDVPCIGTHTIAIPSTNNRLGIKGVGEIATIGGSPAILNAVIDALSGFGVRHLDMPATPERIWRAISASKMSQPSVS